MQKLLVHICSLCAVLRWDVREPQSSQTGQPNAQSCKQMPPSLIPLETVRMHIQVLISVCPCTHKHMYVFTHISESAGNV